MASVIRGGVSGLVAGTVFNTDERQDLSLAGSIPVRLRHSLARWRPAQPRHAYATTNVRGRTP